MSGAGEQAGTGNGRSNRARLEILHTEAARPRTPSREGVSGALRQTIVRRAEVFDATAEGESRRLAIDSPSKKEPGTFRTPAFIWHRKRNQAALILVCKRRASAAV